MLDSIVPRVGQDDLGVGDPTFRTFVDVPFGLRRAVSKTATSWLGPLDRSAVTGLGLLRQCLQPRPHADLDLRRQPTSDYATPDPRTTPAQPARGTFEPSIVNQSALCC